MRRLIVTVVCVLVVGVPVSWSASTSSHAKPVLILVKTAPFTVKGQHFKAREKVRLVLAIGAITRVRSTRAGTAGSFTASFGEVAVPVDRCHDGYAVIATGGSGSRAMLTPQQQKAPGPACPPAP